jgi:hypothetical protein
LKAKLWLLFASLLITLSFASLVSAQTGQVYFKEDFNYANLDQMQAAGWTFTRPAGISVGSGAVVLDGTGGDCAIHYNNHFQTGIFDWKVESKSMWLGQGHSTNGVYVSTERHSYSFSADGYYDEFAFYRDNVKILHFGIYQETANQYFVMTMVRQANTFSLYFNGELKNTYVEEDTQQSAATGMALVSPWRGDAKYDYYMLGEPNAAFTSSNPSATPQVSTDSFPLVPVLVGGGIAALVVGGVVVYYFFIAGGHAGASAGSTTGIGGGGGSGSGSGSGGSVIQEQPISPLSGETALTQLSPGINNIDHSVSILQNDYCNSPIGENLNDIKQTIHDLRRTAQELRAELDPKAKYNEDGIWQGEGPAPSFYNNMGYILLHGVTDSLDKINPLIDTLGTQGQQLMNEVNTQNSASDNSMQNNMEQFTELTNLITNIMQAQQSANQAASELP